MNDKERLDRNPTSMITSKLLGSRGIMTYTLTSKDADNKVTSNRECRKKGRYKTRYMGVWRQDHQREDQEKQRNAEDRVGRRASSTHLASASSVHCKGAAAIGENTCLRCWRVVVPCLAPKQKQTNALGCNLAPKRTP